MQCHAHVRATHAQMQTSCCERDRSSLAPFCRADGVMHGLRPDTQAPHVSGALDTAAHTISSCGCMLPITRLISCSAVSVTQHSAEAHITVIAATPPSPPRRRAHGVKPRHHVRAGCTALATMLQHRVSDLQAAQRRAHLVDDLAADGGDGGEALPPRQGRCAPHAGLPVLDGAQDYLQPALAHALQVFCDTVAAELAAQPHADVARLTADCRDLLPQEVADALEEHLFQVRMPRLPMLCCALVRASTTALPFLRSMHGRHAVCSVRIQPCDHTKAARGPSRCGLASCLASSYRADGEGVSSAARRAGGAGAAAHRVVRAPGARLRPPRAPRPQRPLTPSRPRPPEIPTSFSAGTRSRFCSFLTVPSHPAATTAPAEPAFLHGVRTWALRPLNHGSLCPWPLPAAHARASAPCPRACS